MRVSAHQAQQGEVMRDLFWHFVRERDAIKIRRERGDAPPWTDDAILRDYHFTNVHRSLDPGTRWIIDRLKKSDDVETATFTAYCYRSLNRVETFERRGLPRRELAEIYSWLDALAEDRRAGISIGSRRHQTFFNRLRSHLPHLESLNLCLDFEKTRYDAVCKLARAGVGCGPFFANQIVADLCQASVLDLSGAAAVSSGSRIGLQLLTGQRTSFNVDSQYKERDARRLPRLDGEERELDRLHSDQPTLSAPLDPFDVETCLCEFARYARILSGDSTNAEKRT